MAIDFDANDVAPSTKQQLMTYNGAVRSPAWAECQCVAAPANLEKFAREKFVRSEAVTGEDIKTYDTGNLFVACDSMTGAIPVGELYAVYDVELMIPQSASSFVSASSGVHLGTTSSSLINPFNGMATISGDAALASAAGNVLTILKSGTYEITLSLVGTTFDSTKAVLTTVIGGAIYQELGSTLSATIGVLSDAAAVKGSLDLLYIIPGPNNLRAFTAGQTVSFDFVTNGCAATISAVHIRLAPYEKDASALP